MIQIAGSPLNINTLAQEYDDHSIEWDVLRIMSASDETYSYDSLEDLKFELRLRKELVKAALALYQSEMSFATFHKSHCNEEYWDRMGDGGFRLKNGASPSDAIEDIFKNGQEYGTECATAMIIVYYKALLSIFGKKTFDKVFPSIYLMNWHRLDPLLKEVGIARKAADYLPGDRGYFKNPDVNPQHPEWQGENVIVLPNNRFYGHGIGIQSSDTIINSLNEMRRSDADQTAYLMDSVSRADFKNLAKIYRESNTQPAALIWKPFPARV